VGRAAEDDLFKPMGPRSRSAQDSGRLALKPRSLHESDNHGDKDKAPVAGIALYDFNPGMPALGGLSFSKQDD
jgi:hypothetical protein